MEWEWPWQWQWQMQMWLRSNAVRMLVFRQPLDGALGMLRAVARTSQPRPNRLIVTRAASRNMDEGNLDCSNIFYNLVQVSQDHV